MYRLARLSSGSRQSKDDGEMTGTRVRLTLCTASDLGPCHAKSRAKQGDQSQESVSRKQCDPLRPSPHQRIARHHEHAGESLSGLGRRFPIGMTGETCQSPRTSLKDPEHLLDPGHLLDLDLIRPDRESRASFRPRAILEPRSRTYLRRRASTSSRPNVS